MSIPSGGLAALLVVATFALTSCGGDDGAASATIPATQAPGTAQATQTVTATATQTTPDTQKSQTTTTTGAATTTAPKPTSPTTTAKAPSQSADASGCGPVEIGVREGEIEVTYARITGRRSVSCQTVTIVAQQWGRQQLGIDKALLPKGWECTSGNSCSGAKGGFSFALYKPS